MVAKCHQSTLKYLYKYIYCFIVFDGKWLQHVTSPHLNVYITICIVFIGFDGKWFQNVTSPHLTIYINIYIVLLLLFVNGFNMPPVNT
jgi:hypothetical protein